MTTVKTIGSVVRTTFVSTLVVVWTTLVFVWCLCGVSLALADAFASEGSDSPFYFDESGSMQQRDYWSPNNRSRDYESDRQQYRQYQNQQTQRQNEALMDEYAAQSRHSIAPPRSSSEQFLVYPDGRLDHPKLCTRTAIATYCQ